MIKTGELIVIAVMWTLCFVAGCFSFSIKLPVDESINRNSGDVETILLANTNNVYRFAADTALNVKVQQKKGGKWVDAEHRVLIPEGWFIVSGDGL